MLSADAAALLDRIAIPLDPRRALLAATRGRRGILLARRPGVAGGEPIAAAWLAGPITAELAATAAASPDPVALLVRIVPGGETAIYTLSAASRRIRFAADLGDLDPASVRLPHPRIASRLTSFVFVDRDGKVVRVVAPQPRDLLDLLDVLKADPGIVLTTQRCLAGSLLDRVSRRTMDEAVTVLSRLDPGLSARSRPSPLQRAAIVLAVAAVPVGLIAWPPGAWGLMHLLSASTFAALGYLRYVACTSEIGPRPLAPMEPGELPSYTVLVALYREAHMVRGLVEALERLDYPRDRLEIRLLLEADDVETQAAAARVLHNHPAVMAVVCPPGAPRTKPRALCHGLALARGDLVTVYDAEDRPHPGQLKAAAAAFAAGPDDLACVQARLEIDRVRNALQRQFAIEYELLFEGLLPWLGARRLPLPLGGTSNHFNGLMYQT
ncbi:MAG TPA: glycosyltransferase, partial [Methylomirabilota bacterium]|nr:glycosyltransferase [Methylomirabilota bacterium]